MTATVIFPKLKYPFLTKEKAPTEKEMLAEEIFAKNTLSSGLLQKGLDAEGPCPGAEHRLLLGGGARKIFCQGHHPCGRQGWFSSGGSRGKEADQEYIFGSV